MKNWILILLPAVLIGFSGCEKTGLIGHDEDTEYTCSMHPQIRQKKPGDCPICGMKLVPVLKQQATATTADSAAVATEVRLMPSQNSVASVQLQTVARVVLVRPVQLFGEIKYVNDNHIDLTSFYPGRVERVLIPYNTNEVAAGTALMELYSEEAISDQEKYLQALRDRYLTTFYERDVVSAQIETVRARLFKAGFTEEDLRNLVRKREVKRSIIIRATHGGSIVGVIPHSGERIAQETVMFHITPLDRVWFAARVFEQDLAALQLGQDVEVSTKARPEVTYHGKLVFIDRVIDPQTRTLLARFEIENPKKELLPEMSAIGKLLVRAAEPVLAIPASALIDTGKREVVYVLQAPGQYEQREVIVGTRGEVAGTTPGSYVEIRQGIAEGEQVVVSGAFLIDAEAQLRGSGEETRQK